MSTTTINFVNQNASGVATDADSTPVLSDSAAAYGVERSDTSAIVVASGVSMVRDSAGTYHYTFTDPDTSLTYTYAIQYVYQGETDWIYGTIEGGAASGDTVSKIITATFTDRITGDPITVDAVRLSEPTGTYGARRVSVGTIVAANDTALTDNGSSYFSTTLTNLVPGAEYEYWLEWERSGRTYRKRVVFVAATGATHIYGTEADFDKLIGALNVTIAADRDDDTVADTGVKSDAGDYADAYIDLELSRNGLTAPADVSDHIRYTQFNDVWRHLGVWWIWHARGLTSASRTPEQIAGDMSGYKDYADAQLAKLVEVLASEDTAGDEFLPAMQAVVPTGEQACGFANGW